MTKNTPPEYGLSPGPMIVACVHTNCSTTQQQMEGEMSAQDHAQGLDCEDLASHTP